MHRKRILITILLVIGVVIFLLGVSVGKKHAQVAQKANVIAQKEPEQVKEKIVSLPQTKPDQEPARKPAEKSAAAQTEATPVKKDIIPENRLTMPLSRSRKAGSSLW